MAILMGLRNFFTSVFNALCSIFTVIIGGLAYCIGYPAVQTMLVAVLVLFVLDFFTRFYAIKVQSGGLYKAFVNKKFSSKAFWNGFLTKVIGYFAILTVANFAKITPELSLIGGIVSPVFYTALFFYESISNLENLRDAGLLAAIPLLNRLNKEKDKYLDTETNSEEVN
jgi:phage-related holin